MGAVVIKRTDANETCHSDSSWMLLAGIGWQLAIEAPHVRLRVWRGPLIEVSRSCSMLKLALIGLSLSKISNPANIDGVVRQEQG